jgi:hypothetical protein
LFFVCVFVFASKGYIPAMIFGGEFEPILCAVKNEDSKNIIFENVIAVVILNVMYCLVRVIMEHEGFMGRNYWINYEGTKYYCRPVLSFCYIQQQQLKSCSMLLQT